MVISKELQALFTSTRMIAALAGQLGTILNDELHFYLPVVYAVHRADSYFVISVTKGGCIIIKHP